MPLLQFFFCVFTTVMEEYQKRVIVSEKSNLERPLFEMCCFHWALPEMEGGGGRLARMVWSIFSPTFTWGCKVGLSEISKIV